MSEKLERRFNILVCVDGSEESYRGLRYAVRLGSGTDADLTLLYVRPVDQGLRTGGLDASVIRENMLNWGLEMPGMKSLKKARDMLVDLGYMAEDWDEEFKHVDVRGTSLGDNMIIYHSDEGRSITLKLMVSPSVVRGILDECELHDYDITIVDKSSDGDATGPGYISHETANVVAMEHSGTVIVAHGLEESHGHLVCVRDTDASIEAARRDAQIASRCACPVFLFSVAEDETEKAAAQNAIDRARAAIEDEGIKISGEKVAIGDPVDKIVEEGRQYSMIVLATTEQKGWRRFFTTSVAGKVLEKAHNSVMIAR